MSKKHSRKPKKMKRKTLLTRLKSAESAVKSNLRASGLDENIRAHLSLAQAHLKEAFTAINERRRVRTVSQLVNDWIFIHSMLMHQGKPNYV